MVSAASSILKRIREEIGLSSEELASFRRWFAEYAADPWDRQIERDVKEGKLDALAERALAAHSAPLYTSRKSRDTGPSESAFTTGHSG